MSTLYTEEWLTGPSNTSFFTRTYTPPASTTSSTRAVLVFLHGFDEHCVRFEGAHSAYASHGIAVFTFDQRGFGRTALDKDKKSKGSKYGKTTWKDQFADAQWALETAIKAFPGVPAFLMGHSMGGGLALGFPTKVSPESVSTLNGIIATSPLLAQSVPVSKVLRFVGAKMALVAPSLSFPAEVIAEDLTHDPVEIEKYKKDPLIKPFGTLKGLDDMLSGGEALLATEYKKWPKTLPLLIIHGDADKVTSCAASKEFIEKVDADDKKHSIYEGGLHELQHEPNGVKEKLTNEVIAWIDAHIKQGDGSKL